MEPGLTAHRVLPWGLMLATGLAHAGLDSWGEQKNRFMISPRAGFNMEVDFSNLGGFPARTDIGPAAPGFDHNYDDGFNRVDSSGNAGGATWYFRYDNASQVNEQGDGDTLVMSSTAASGKGIVNGVSDDPRWSGEITYARELGWNSSYWYGLVVGLSYTDLRIGQNHTFRTDALTTRDSYRILGPLPPAPYEGSYDVPGVQISGTPVRTTSTVADGASTDGFYELDAEGYGLRLGLLFETPFTEWLDLQFGGGVAGMWIRSDFTVQETTTIYQAGTLQRNETGSDQDLVVGAYAELGFSLHVGKRVSLYAGGQYFYLTDYTHRLDPEEAELSFKNSIYGVIGMSYGF